ncbi:hypothetical protein ACEQPO_12580 [Bacillus sp. SL00103]
MRGNIYAPNKSVTPKKEKTAAIQLEQYESSQGDSDLGRKNNWQNEYLTTKAGARDVFRRTRKIFLDHTCHRHQTPDERTICLKRLKSFAYFSKAKEVELHYLSITRKSGM